MGRRERIGEEEGKGVGGGGRDRRDTPYKHLSQVSRLLQVNPLLRAAQLDVHVAVDGDEAALVLGLAPL